MKTIGIIAEYNPFHNGHMYQLEQIKSSYSNTHTISLMSGCFLQRGVPAISNKFHRARLAAIAGIDAVIELPFVYATSSARDFAMAGITLFNKLKDVDYLAFGAECDDLGLLTEIACIITDDNDDFSKMIKEYTSNGMSYPAAREKAVITHCKKASDVINKPNNILAIEYLSALKRTKSHIKPIIIKRKESSYNDTEIKGNICSASAIRNMLQDNTISDDDKKNIIKQVLPDSVSWEFLSDYKNFFPIYENDLTPFLQARMLFQPDDKSDIFDMTTELSNKLKKTDFCNSFSQISDLLKTKEITQSHINRALIHLLLDVKKEHIDTFKENDWVFYAHILALRKSESGILKEIKNDSSIPVFTKTADAINVLTDIGKMQLIYDINATRLYKALVYNKFKNVLPDDYTVKIPVV